jgi:hypothetical protein
VWLVVEALPGDFNNDGAVDATEYVTWRRIVGMPAGYTTRVTLFGESLGNGAGNQTSAPEPVTGVLIVISVAGILSQRPRALPIV